MPGLVRQMVRTAAVVVTVTMESNAVTHRQADKIDPASASVMNTAYAQQPPQQQSAPPPPQEQYAPPAPGY
jgi:hypothetical protein